MARLKGKGIGKDKGKDKGKVDETVVGKGEENCNQ